MTEKHCILFNQPCVHLPAHMHIFAQHFYVQILRLVCMWVFFSVHVIWLREIISRNVHWPDSQPVLGFFGCINILEELPGETESLCKHNHQDCVHVLYTADLIIRTEVERFAHTVF